ncbi:hypothetical protein HFP72_04005 [Nocardiopsis sp. ARC36]
MPVPELKDRRHLAGVDVHGWNVLPQEVTVVGDGDCSGRRGGAAAATVVVG